MWKEKVLHEKLKHPDWGYRKIADSIGCHRDTVRYYLRPTRSAEVQARIFIRNRQIKEELVEKAGGSCCRCGYDKCIAALQFHHTDPSIKLKNIAHLRVTAARKEAQKCILLCANCHAEEHFNRKAARVQ